MMKKLVVVCMMMGLLVGQSQVMGGNISLVAGDGFGVSSFNSGLNWSDGLAPSAGNDYFTSTFRVRTPADNGSYVFGGDSLTIDSTAGAPGDLLGLSYKGTGAGASITVNNLILNGGAVNHINGSGDIFNLYGSINVIADSYIYAKQGPINIYSDISGSRAITNPGSDGSGRTLTFYSAASTFTGNIVNNGRFALADNAVLNFVIGASGVNNGVSGSGAETVFDGDFVFDLLSAGTNIGDSWVVAGAANQTFGATFNVVGFADMGGDLWSANANSVTYQFDESTGILSVVPEPATLILLGLGGFLIRRKC